MGAPKLKDAATNPWVARWLEMVVAGAAMTQRSLASIDRFGGGLAAVKKAAKQRGVHLLLVTDDRGRQIVAASRWPLKVIC
jgi:hypothetical protein